MEVSCHSQEERQGDHSPIEKVGEEKIVWRMEVGEVGRVKNK